MKRIYLIIFGLVMLAEKINAQSKEIDQAAYNAWERLEETSDKSCLLSSSGNFVLFRTQSSSKGSLTVLKNVKSGKERTYANAFNEQCFSQGKYFVFQLGGDSLAIFDTHHNRFRHLTGVKSFFVIRAKAGDRLGFFSETAGKKLLVTCNIDGSVISKFSDLDDVTFNQSNTEIAYFIKTADDLILRHINLLTGVHTNLLNDFFGLAGSFKPELQGISFKEDNIFYKVSRVADTVKQRDDKVISKAVNVWSYQDLYLQDRQQTSINTKVQYTWMINIKSRKVFQIDSDSLRLTLLGNSDKYFVLATPINENEFYWNRQQMRIYLFSVETGEKRLIKEAGFPGLSSIGVSPDNRFLAWFDGKDGNYYSYEIASRKTTRISNAIDNSLRDLNDRSELSGLVTHGYPQNGQYWVNGGQALIVNAKKDIWKLDPSGGQKPVNLTNGYGERNNIRFRPVETGSWQNPVLLETGKDECLVWAFNNRNKQNGFWKIRLNKQADPVKLVMSDDAYFFTHRSSIVPANSEEDPSKFSPIKAANANLFVFRRQNSFSVPNLFATSDFKKFKQLSDITASGDQLKVYSKLITYTLPDGRKADGILHLPEHLDTTKKYPIIFNYYERRSETLNIRRVAELTGHNINIPWYLSRGYLVFEPDFYYRRGETAESVIECVKAAVDKLSKLSYVDIGRMGAQGQSFGGYESNVLAVQTNMFKAVCAMAGPTNLISEYGSLRPGGFNNQLAEDVGQRNLGVFPWDQPEVFIRNSPNFHIRNATTPLLLVHNKGDGAILFSQAIELYLGMRRLNKKVWMLEYDKEGHSIYEEREKIDFNTRMQQFFDHYLKGVLAPYWMTRGIGASMKGIDSGLELDREIKTPGEGIARPIEKGKIF